MSHSLLRLERARVQYLDGTLTAVFSTRNSRVIEMADEAKLNLTVEQNAVWLSCVVLVKNKMLTDKEAQEKFFERFPEVKAELKRQLA